MKDSLAKQTIMAKMPSEYVGAWLDRKKLGPMRLPTE